jgi:hypothetical protein
MSAWRPGWSRPGVAKRARVLTEGERNLAASIFGRAIDYDAVRVKHRKWFPFQPRNTLMAPTGHVHVPRSSDHWSENYAAERPSLQGLFIHELTHVWQAQTRGKYYLPLMRHPFCRYNYELVPGRPFESYGLEQQAEIVRHAFLAGLGLPITTSAEALAALLPFAGEAVRSLKAPAFEGRDRTG